MKSKTLSLLLWIALFPDVSPLPAQETNGLVDGANQAVIALKQAGESRTYELSTTAELRDNKPADKRITFSEVPAHATVRSGNLLFDGLYAMAVKEALKNSVAQISDGAYGNGVPVRLDAYQTGEFWTYVWTRDLAYSTYLALAGFDPGRAVNSLLFKSSAIKDSVHGGSTNQIIQDTGSGGSYPVSSDRMVWTLGASETLKYLSGAERQDFLEKAYSILCGTIEQDRRVIFDPSDGLYRGEESFLDWREQTYPRWVSGNVLPIALSKSLSVNAAAYFTLQTASEYARLLRHPTEQARYAGWAKDLKKAINRGFFDRDSGLYSAYLFSDLGPAVRVHRLELLGESLAILLGVADQSQAESILSHYPVGPYGPPVVWPQDRYVPIYHNQAIWPFVTAYWIKAARQANYAEAVDAGVRSLVRGAAFNLSNMENYDFVSGRPNVQDRPLKGPVVNSRRQLWSVAAYLSMVQDIVFGLDASWEGIRFRPYITGRFRNETLAATNRIALRNFAYRGKTIGVLVHLPPAGTGGSGACPITGIELNGKSIREDFVAADSLSGSNQWDVYLGAPAKGSQSTGLNMVTIDPEGRAIFGPAQPEWENTGQRGISLAGNRLELHYGDSAGSNVLFNIYRDGRLAAKGLTQTTWQDPDSADYASKTHFYTIEAVDALSGNASHLAPTRFYAPTNTEWTIPAKEMENRGGKLAEDHYFMDWGKPEHELVARNFTAPRTGEFLVRAEFSDGMGNLTTGITCGLKKMEVSELDSGSVIASGYLVMPQSGNWKRFDLSSGVRVFMEAGKSYSIRLSEDEYSRNMSYLKNNERYTAFQGGGPAPYNYVNIAGLHLLWISAERR